MPPSQEEFLSWKANPTTQWVLKALRSSAEAQKTHWVTQSWDDGKADPEELIALRERASAYTAIEEASYERLCDLNDDDPIFE